VANTTLDQLFETLSRAPRRHVLVALAEWNRETGTIRRGPRYDEVVPLLELRDVARDELSAD